LKLVLSPGHVLCRWDSPEERFNIEFHAHGLNSLPDDHYKESPIKWSPELRERERVNPMYLISLTPQQELSHCAFNRACQLDVAARYQEALAAMHVAYQFWPNPAAGVWVTHLTTKVMYPDRYWPQVPCEETAGQKAFQRLVTEKGVIVV
jgi:hypothetical protein